MRRVLMWPLSARIALLMPVACLWTFLLDVARGNALASAATYGLVATAILVVCAIAGAAIER